MIHISQESLTALIYQHFPTEPLPKKIAVHYSGGYEGTYVDAIFTGKKWTEITIDGIWEHWMEGNADETLIFLSAEAFRYYLPFFLCYSLKPEAYHKGFYLPIWEEFLLPKEYGGGEGSVYYFDVVKTYNTTQKNVLFLYIAFFYNNPNFSVERENIKKAMDFYWGQYACRIKEDGTLEPVSNWRECLKDDE